MKYLFNLFLVFITSYINDIITLSIISGSGNHPVTLGLKYIENSYSNRPIVNTLFSSVNTWGIIELRFKINQIFDSNKEIQVTFPERFTTVFSNPITVLETSASSNPLNLEIKQALF